MMKPNKHSKKEAVYMDKKEEILLELIAASDEPEELILALLNYASLLRAASHNQQSAASLPRSSQT